MLKHQHDKKKTQIKKGKAQTGKYLQLIHRHNKLGAEITSGENWLARGKKTSFSPLWLCTDTLHRCICTVRQDPQHGGQPRGEAHITNLSLNGPALRGNTSWKPNIQQPQSSSSALASSPSPGKWVLLALRRNPQPPSQSWPCFCVAAFNAL